MDITSAIKLLPQGWPHFPSEPVDKKITAESVIEEVLNQIIDENRNPTKWECDGVSNAMGAVLFGSYTLAVSNAMSCFYSKAQVSRPEVWWEESEEHSTDTLKTLLEMIKGYPPRIMPK